MISSIKSILTSEDPLSETALDFLLSYCEEDDHLDYKETLAIDEERVWLNLTKDFLAFVNTEGGFILLGIRDGTYEQVGLENKIAIFLSDTNRIQQKVNRYIDPSITNIRAKRFERNSKQFVDIFIPQSKSHTHIVTKEAYFLNERKEHVTVLRPGVIYVRNSGTNAIMDSTSFEKLLDRRIENFKESLMSKIVKVVEAPSSHDIIIFDPNSSLTSEQGKQVYRISSSPSAIPLAGMSFTIPPTTDEQLISSWIALSKNDLRFQPRDAQIFRIYARRLQLTLNEEQKIWMAIYSIMADGPIFFWMKGFATSQFEKVLSIAVQSPSFQVRTSVLHVSAFLGRKHFRRYLGLLSSDEVQRLAPSGRDYPKAGPFSLFYPGLVGTASFKKIATQPKDLEEEASLIANKIAEEKDEPLERQILIATDCKLYALENGVYDSGVVHSAEVVGGEAVISLDAAKEA